MTPPVTGEDVESKNFPTHIDDKIWCVRNPRGSWCRIRGGRQPNPGVHISANTSCGYELSLSRGFKRKKMPTCRQCLDEWRNSGPLPAPTSSQRAAVPKKKTPVVRKKLTPYPAECSDEEWNNFSSQKRGAVTKRKRRLGQAVVRLSVEETTVRPA